MGFKSVILVLAFMLCFVNPAASQVAKNYTIEPPFPIQDLLGKQMVTDVRDAFKNESLFTTRHDTEMKPGAPGSIARMAKVNTVPLGPTPAAGNWSLKLTDVRPKHFSLNLYQSEDAVFGYGNLTDNNTIDQLTAGGTVMGDRLAMYIIPGSSQNLYRMWLTLGPSSMEGSYILSSSGVLQYGSIIGSKVGTSS
ncbi:MAG: hypothetical protein LUQ22_08320 [Methanotrichaceae archaeon]|nr:hypothetical protein [Methanotrichaceae archaeon]